MNFGCIAWNESANIAIETGDRVEQTHEEVDVDSVAGDSKRRKLLSNAGLDLPIG